MDTPTAASGPPRRKRKTVGPQDAGRLMTLEQFESARLQPGYIYELIDGVLTVSPNPRPLHAAWQHWLLQSLHTYAHEHPEVVNHVTTGCEVCIPGRPGPTRPQPDVAAFVSYPDFEHLPPDWDELCPVLIVEIISRRRPRRDTVRNRNLYWMAGGIAEYWIIDPRKDRRRPTLTALRREAGQTDWLEQVVPGGEPYETPLLPGFRLVLSQG